MIREEKNGLTRLRRAAIVRDQVLERGRTAGRWERVDLGDGRDARIWLVEGEGWEAHVVTRFSGTPRGAAVARGYDDAVLLQLAPPRESDLLVDVYHPQAGKVLSIGSADGVDELIGMQPGPWEVLFGLPAREWTPAVARRLATRSGRSLLRSA